MQLLLSFEIQVVKQSNRDINTQRQTPIWRIRHITTDHVSFFIIIFSCIRNIAFLLFESTTISHGTIRNHAPEDDRNDNRHIKCLSPDTYSSNKF